MEFEFILPMISDQVPTQASILTPLVFTLYKKYIFCNVHVAAEYAIGTVLLYHWHEVRRPEKAHFNKQNQKIWIQ